VLIAAGETETTQENIQDWLELDEGVPRFQLLTEEEIAAVIFLYLFSSPLPMLLHFSFICFINIFCLLFHQSRLSRKPGDLSPPPKLIRISEGLPYSFFERFSN
jgi:hypothetical protein